MFVYSFVKGALGDATMNMSYPNATWALEWLHAQNFVTIIISYLILLESDYES